MTRPARRAAPGAWIAACCVAWLGLGSLAPPVASAQLGRRLSPTAVRSSAPDARRTASALVEPSTARSSGDAEHLGRRLDAPEARPSGEGVEAGPSGWAFDLAAMTSLPLSVGLEATLQTPIGVFLQLSAGHTPNAYLDAVADLLGDAGVYAENLRPLLDEAIAGGAWNVRAGLGFSTPEGFELSGGYTYLTSSAELSPQAIEAAAGQRIPWPSGTTRIPIALSIHAVYGRIGWRFVVEDHFVLRLALGWTHALSSDATLEVPDELRRVPGDPAGEIQAGVSDGLAEYGFTPEAILSAGYRF